MHVSLTDSDNGPETMDDYDAFHLINEEIPNNYGMYGILLQ